MAIQTVLVCETQVPFVTGGAESLVRSLVDQLRARGYLTDLVSLPFKWYPKEEILAHAAAWRLLDLSESNGRPVDLLIGTKFPSYFARHPRKVAWLIHQHRAAYELCGTEYSDFRACRPRTSGCDRSLWSSTARCSKSAAAGSRFPRPRASGWNGSTGCAPIRSITRPGWPGGSGPDRMETMYCQWAGSNRSSGSICC